MGRDWAHLVLALVLSMPLQPFTGIDRIRKATQGTLARRQCFGSGGNGPTNARPDPTDPMSAAMVSTLIDRPLIESERRS